MKKILFVLDAFGFFGGPERRAFRIARGLQEFAEYQVIIASIMKTDERVVDKAKETNIEVYEVTNEGNKSLKSYRVDVFMKLKKLIKYVKPDIIFTFEFLADYTTKMALLGKNIPIFTFIGSTEWKWEKKWHRRFAMKRFVRKSRYYIVNSNRVKENMLRALPSTKEKLYILYNPIDATYFKPLNAKLKTRRKFNINEKDFVVGSIIRFYNPKGADVLIEAFYKSGINAKLVLVGDGSMREKLENMVKEFNIKHKVLFLGALEATPEIYSLFDLSVVPSQNGGFDNVVIESMACGIPTIATYATGIGEIAEHKEHLFITNTDVDSITEAIKHGYCSHEIMKETAIKGKMLIKSKLDIKQITEQIGNLV